jgi:hypothetical protein
VIIMDKATLNAIASDAFLQAEQGLAVELDPELADAMGAFAEDAVSLADLAEDEAAGS